MLLADGTTKPIADVEVGDLVLALDPRTGERGPREVEAVIAGAGEKRLIALTLATGDGVATLRATAQHPFWLATEGRWAYAEDLTPGDLLLTAEGTWVRVLRADETQVSATTVINLTVAGLHTFYVMGEGGAETSRGTAVLVHNARNRGIDDACGVPLPNRGDLRKLDDRYLKQQGIDPHGFNQDHLPKGAKIAHWDIYRDAGSGELFLMSKNGVIIETGEYLS